jgi:hypothetical protein
MEHGRNGNLSLVENFDIPGDPNLKYLLRQNLAALKKKKISLSWFLYRQDSVVKN